MNAPLDRATLAFVDPRGRTVGQLAVIDRRGPSILVLTEDEAAERGEERLQLLESRVYDFELAGAPPDLWLEESAVVQPSRVDRRLGRLEPGLATGLLPLVLVDARDEVVARASVEVRTNKINYQFEYRRMLDDLARQSTALLMEIRGTSRARMSAARRRRAESLHQQFVLVRSLLESREMVEAVDQIFGQPHRQWVTEAIRADPRQVAKSSPSLLRQLVRDPHRVRLPAEHPMAARLRRYGVAEPSLPARFDVERHSDSSDTPENRFVKHAFEDWETFLLAIERPFSRSTVPSERRLGREVSKLRTRISTWLSHDLFAEVGRLELLPLGSPVLQRRSGYREVLSAWLTFQLATVLVWRGGDDVFGAGKRDVALLYEYWVFFELLRIVRAIFDLDAPPSRELIARTADGLDLRLKSGNHLSFQGRYTSGSRPLSVRFSYNRTFGRSGADPQSNYPAEGSWTRRMRPDYTLSLWPSEFTAAEAERQELMVHVHFDAKYRVEDLTGLFGSDTDEEVDEERQALRQGTAPKRSDLLKMHAYRDAIRRSEGAYVIYPGRRETENLEWLAYSEILPGLGAFALRPGAEEAGRGVVQSFLRDVADFVCGETTRLEQQTYHVFRIQEPSGAYRWHVDVPTRDSSARELRRRPEAEH